LLAVVSGRAAALVGIVSIIINSSVLIMSGWISLLSLHNSINQIKHFSIVGTDALQHLLIRA
jgi:hypothetical protein